MFIRGSGFGSESTRNDESFYRGIVVRNNDPLKMNRVKIFIPEISNQPLENWFDEFENIITKSPGFDNWEDIPMFEEIVKNIPWAEPCFPLFGESGNLRYSKKLKKSTVSDCNYPEGFNKIDNDIPSLSGGTYAPAFIYENKTTTLGDAFSNPVANFTMKCNTFSFGYKPMKFTNKTKGVIGIPEVGSKVWVFHYQGDLNFPVYFGVSQDFRSLTLINNTDNTSMISDVYPKNFEN
jgi:hypothetical protein